MGLARDLPTYVVATDTGCVVEAFVQPRATRDALVGVHGSAIKLKVTAPPVDDKANRAVEALLARTLGLPRSAVSVTSGATSRHKRVAVTGMTAQMVSSALVGVLSSPAHDPGQEVETGRSQTQEDGGQEDGREVDRGQKDG